MGSSRKRRQASQSAELWVERLEPRYALSALGLPLIPLLPSIMPQIAAPVVTETAVIASGAGTSLFSAANAAAAEVTAAAQAGASAGSSSADAEPITMGAMLAADMQATTPPAPLVPSGASVGLEVTLAGLSVAAQIDAAAPIADITSDIAGALSSELGVDLNAGLNLGGAVVPSLIDPETSLALGLELGSELGADSQLLGATLVTDIGPELGLNLGLNVLGEDSLLATDLGLQVSTLDILDTSALDLGLDLGIDVAGGSLLATNLALDSESSGLLGLTSPISLGSLTVGLDLSADLADGIGLSTVLATQLVGLSPASGLDQLLTPLLGNDSGLLSLGLDLEVGEDLTSSLTVSSLGLIDLVTGVNLSDAGLGPLALGVEVDLTTLLVGLGGDGAVNLYLEGGFDWGFNDSPVGFVPGDDLGSDLTSTTTTDDARFLGQELASTESSSTSRSGNAFVSTRDNDFEATDGEDKLKRRDKAGRAKFSEDAGDEVEAMESRESYAFSERVRAMLLAPNFAAEGSMELGLLIASAGEAELAVLSAALDGFMEELGNLERDLLQSASTMVPWLVAVGAATFAAAEIVRREIRDRRTQKLSPSASCELAVV